MIQELKEIWAEKQPNEILLKKMIPRMWINKKRCCCAAKNIIIILKKLVLQKRLHGDRIGSFGELKAAARFWL